MVLITTVFTFGNIIRFQWVSEYFSKYDRSSNIVFNPSVSANEIQKSTLQPADPYRFNWTIVEKKICTEDEPKIKFLIFMHIAPQNVKKRFAYRRMYGDENLKKMGFYLLFTLGHSKNHSVNELIKNESTYYHDIIQQNFIDAYQNLTWKALMSLRFVKEYCNHVQYIISTDDDVLINLWEVVRMLTDYEKLTKSKESLEKTIFCYVIRHAKVVRDPKHRWYQSRLEVPTNYYPTYCSALVIIIPSPLVMKLFDACKNESFNRIDDYFLTGVLGNKAGSIFVDISKKAYNHEYKPDRKAFLSKRIYFQTTATIEQAEEMWNELKRGYEVRKKR